MTYLGLHHYGGTLALYDQPIAEQARALALFDEMLSRSARKTA